MPTTKNKKKIVTRKEDSNQLKRIITINHTSIIIVSIFRKSPIEQLIFSKKEKL